MIKKISQILMALVLSAGVIATSAYDAEARRGRGLGFGIAAGIIGLSILGAYAHGRGRPYYYGAYGGDYCYRGARRCGWTGRHCFYNRYDDYVCRGGRYACWRPTYCD